MNLMDAPFATLLVVKERMNDDEYRQMLYVRREGDPMPAPMDKFLPVYGIATTQGHLWRP